MGHVHTQYETHAQNDPMWDTYRPIMAQYGTRTYPEWPNMGHVHTQHDQYVTPTYPTWLNMGHLHTQHDPMCDTYIPSMTQYGTPTCPAWPNMGHLHTQHDHLQPQLAEPALPTLLIGFNVNDKQIYCKRAR